MRSKDVLIKIMKRSGGERGIRIMSPNANLSEGHIRKADHNLVVMTDLQKLGHEDWVAIAAYYAMYHSAMALLVRIGLESKDHAATAAALDYFFGKDVSKELLKKFQTVRDKKDKIENERLGQEDKDLLGHRGSVLSSLVGIGSALSSSQLARHAAYAISTV